MKKIETLFHGTKKFEHLISIIENGFYSSYANEFLFQRKNKILMVSFSNIPLIEARNQVDYGEYFIGLKRAWGIENKLHPIAYTFEKSKFETDIHRLIEESAIGQSIELIDEHLKKGVEFQFVGESVESIVKLLNQNLQEITISTIKELFGNIFSKVHSISLYLKHFKVNDNDGNLRYAYNDREWRFIPENLGTKIIFESDASGRPIPEYQEWENKDKPHFANSSLKFNLDDINYIIVKEPSEMKKAFETLYNKFEKDKVLSNVENGTLTVLPLENVLNDL
jgi:hypothetical protein